MIASSRARADAEFLLLPSAGAGGRARRWLIQLAGRRLTAFLGVSPNTHCRMVNATIDDALIRVHHALSSTFLVAAPRGRLGREIEPEHVIDVLQKLRESYTMLCGPHTRSTHQLAGSINLRIVRYDAGHTASPQHPRPKLLTDWSREERRSWLNVGAR